MAMQPIPNFSNLSPILSGTSTATARPATAGASVSESTTPVQGTATDGPVPQAALPKQPTREQLDQAMKEVKQALPQQARDLQFSIDDETGQTVIKVMDPATKEVIRQIPSEELLAITKALDKFTGLLTKQKV